jgi:hypothetical protein
MFRELALPTQRSLWRVSGRATGPLWKPSFADQADKSTRLPLIRIRGTGKDRPRA